MFRIGSLFGSITLLLLAACTTEAQPVPSPEDWPTVEADGRGGSRRFSQPSNDHGSTDSARWEEATTAAGPDFTYRLIVSRNNSRVIQMIIEADKLCVQETSAAGVPVGEAAERKQTFFYKYYEFNEPITIDLPEGFE